MTTLAASPQTRPAKVAGPPGKHWPELVASRASDRVVPEVEPEIEQPNAASQVHVNGNSGRGLSLLGRIAKPLLAFHNLLAGPPMSDRERFNAAVAEARLRINQGPTSSWWIQR